MENFKKWLLENTNDFWGTYRNFLKQNDLRILGDYLQDKGYNLAGEYLLKFLENPRLFVLANQKNSKLCTAFSEFPDLTSIILEQSIRSFLPRSYQGLSEIDYPEIDEEEVLGTTYLIEEDDTLDIVFKFKYTNCYIEDIDFNIRYENNQEVDLVTEARIREIIINLLNSSLKPYFQFCNNFC